MRLLITGGSGTFGQAMIARALADEQWTGVISLSRDEQKAAALAERFGSHRPFKAFLGDVRDSNRLAMAFRGVDVVVHAAALKRVDVGAYSPSELIKTNIIGTMNVVQAAINAGVKSVVVLSSDKSVSATNLYGATKHCAETYAVQSNSYAYPSGTVVSAVRYGNILGSRGSVIHIWRDQIRRGVPMTITDQRMTRFVMTIEQAVSLVEYAIRNANGGEVFVPMLPAARMTTLAEAVGAEGRDPYTGSLPKWEFTGLRPGGEKLAERLLNEEEIQRARILTAPNAGLGGGIVAITPSCHEWIRDDFQWAGVPVTADVGFSSDDAFLLSVPDLRDMIDNTEACR